LAAESRGEREKGKGERENVDYFIELIPGNNPEKNKDKFSSTPSKISQRLPFPLFPFLLRLPPKFGNPPRAFLKTANALPNKAVH
jgi:hypothetical protein